MAQECEIIKSFEQFNDLVITKNNPKKPLVFGHYNKLTNHPFQQLRWGTSWPKQAHPLSLCAWFDGMYGFAMIRLDAMSLFQKDDNMGSSVFNHLISRTQLAKALYMHEVLYLLYAHDTIDP